MSNWLKIRCPGCKQQKDVAPGNAYRVCDKCGTPHCQVEQGPCKAGGCTGWLKEQTNPR